MNGSDGVLVVTGGGRGIGACVARLGAARGFAVAVNYASNEGAAAEVVAAIEAVGGRALAIQGDVAVEADVIHLFETAARELGPIRALVNNAGITGPMTRVDELTLAVLDRVFAVNVIGSMLCAREAIRRMSTRHGGGGGAIVNLSSIASKLGGGGDWVHYAASKGAIDTMTVGLSREVAQEGIRVNAVSPGLIETEIHGPGDRLVRLTPAIPMQRVGKPEEVAEAILWLLSPAASYVTGTIVGVSGGR